MRGGRSYGGRGSMRGNGQYRSSNRMDNANRASGSRYKDSYNSGGPNRGNTRFQSNYVGNNSHDASSSAGGHYEARSRNKFNSSSAAGGSNRHDVNLSRKNYRDSRENSRDRLVDRKRMRQDDYRRTNARASSTGGGRGNRTPPPPPLPSTAASHYRGNNATASSSNHNYRNLTRLPAHSNNNNSRISSGTGANNSRQGAAAAAAAAAGTKLTPRYRNANNRLGMRTNTYRQRNDLLDDTAAPNFRRKIIRNSRISRDAAELRIMRRKLLLAQHKDRAHVVRIARLSSSLRRSRLDQRSKSPRRAAAARSRKSQDDNELSPYNRSKSSRERHSDEQHKKGETETVKKRKSTSPRNAYKSNRGKSEENSSNELNDSSKAKDEKDERKNNNNKKRDNVIVTLNNDADNSATEAANNTSIKTNSTTNKNESDNDSSTKSNNNKIDDKIIDYTATDEEAVSALTTTEEKAKKKSARNDDDAAAASDSNLTVNDHDDNDDDDNANENGEAKKKVISMAIKSKIDNPERRRFIKLTCVNCHMKCTTFKQYSEHLYSYQHKTALRQIGMRQRAYLLRLRARQRAAQREIEANNKEVYEPKFCYLCRLHYRQQKAKHQLSQHHKAMRKFLLPYCTLCRIAFKSPLTYEIHRCSLEHIRCKANSGIVETESETEMDTNEIDLNQFLTVDSVGEIDLDQNPMDDDDNDMLSESGDNKKSNTDDDSNTIGGTSFIKRINAYYCELCNEFSKTNIDINVFISQHCAEIKHQKHVIEYEEKLLNEQKVKLQQELQEEEAKEKQQELEQQQKQQEQQQKQQEEQQKQQEQQEKEQVQQEKLLTEQQKGTKEKKDEVVEIIDLETSSSIGEPAAKEKEESMAAVEPQKEKGVEKTASNNAEPAQQVVQKPSIISSNAEKVQKKHRDADDDEVDSEEKLWADVDKDLGDLLAVMSNEVQDHEEEDEDESVLNIDIESEKPKLKEKELNGKKEDNITSENVKIENQTSATEKKVAVVDAKNIKTTGAKEQRPAAQRRQIKKITSTPQK